MQSSGRHDDAPDDDWNELILDCIVYLIRETD